ncbi:hypothetical protein FDECE_18075, partial [Fusarium decemcellulare]
PPSRGMFQPQPTPLASSSFASYGLASELDFGFPVSAGGGGAGLLYGSPQPQSQQRQQSQALLLHQIPQQQQLSSSNSPSSPFSSSQASIANPSPPPNVAPRDNRSYQQHQLPHRPHPQQHQAYSAPPGVVVPKMEDQGQHDMAAQQAAAKDYQPGLKVGNKTPSSAITREYAKADPVYIDKTMTLSQTYSEYRPIQGDGNCGWRGIGFSYFEKLVESGDQGKVEGEVARLLSMSQMIADVGGYSYFEDFLDEMIGLLRDVAQNMNNPQLAQILVLERWNDPNSAGGLIYYLRLLAATYLKANANTYTGFLTNSPSIEEYCRTNVELPDREIEHLGIIALVHTLLKPVNFVLEIAYLDRSPGTQANQYRFPDEANGQPIANLGPIIYLLYRPDHYDILYQPPIPIPSAPISMQVNRV